jgi:alkylation response protein AidB-like acyl-CoA dehydrogenase
MSYNFTEEQVLIQKMVSEVALEKIEPYAAIIDKTGKYPEELKKVLKEQGLLSLPFPEEYGGGGGDCLTTCIVLEELSKVCGNTAMVVATNELGTMPLLIAGNEEQKKKYLTPIASGEAACCFGLTEPDAGSDVASMRTTAQLKDDEYIINGSKQWISFADVSDYICLFAKTDSAKGLNGISAFIVEMNREGITIGKKEEKMGFNGFNSCELFFDDLRVPKENLLGGEGKGFRIAMQTLDSTRPLIGAVGVGTAQGALDYAVKYSKKRTQFGQPICNFQGLQFMMADMAMKNEAARQLVYKAACAIDDNHPQMSMFGAMAKCFATDVAVSVTIDSLQVLGGYGYMKEYPMERKMRDAKLLQIVEGTNQIQRVVIARNILK